MDGLATVAFAVCTWITASISGTANHGIDPLVAWHARAMMLAWGMLVPVGALAARFFKVMPRQDWPRELDDRTWWRLHLGLQYAGIAITLLGVVLVVWTGSVAGLPRSVHGVLGWLTVCAGLAQVVAGWLRGSKGGPSARTSAPVRGDHYEMTPRRILFERVHKSLGWMAIVVAWVTILAGLVLADAPRWMPVLIFAWWLALAAVFVRLQRAGRCVDTYQAIWGPSPEHPGNRRRPIGIGVRRPAAGSGRDP